MATVSSILDLCLDSILRWFPVLKKFDKRSRPPVVTSYWSEYKPILLLTAVGLACWWAGWLARSYYQREKDRKKPKIIQFPDNGKSELKKFMNMPGLPVFASVSVATLKSTSESTLVPDPRRNSEIIKYEYPSLDQLLVYDDFVVCYNRRTKVANWVFEHLPSVWSFVLRGDVYRSKSMFREDEAVHKCFRTTVSDYSRSGFDRGHLAAAGNHIVDQEYFDQTFYLTNIAPQVKTFNGHVWNNLEQHVRKKVAIYRNVYVCTGPLYLAELESNGKKYVKYQVIGTSEIAVPNHFFKIIVMETNKGKFHLESYIMPNEAACSNDYDHLENYYASPETIEMSGGLLFFDELNRSRLEMINGVKATFI